MWIQLVLCSPSGSIESSVDSSLLNGNVTRLNQSCEEGETLYRPSGTVVTMSTVIDQELSAAVQKSVQ
jgi:hypothetical protein